MILASRYSACFILIRKYIGHHHVSLTAEEEGGRQNKKQLLVIVLVTIAMFIILLGTIMCYMQRRVLKSIGNLLKLRVNIYVESLLFQCQFSG